MVDWSGWTTWTIAGFPWQDWVWSSTEFIALAAALWSLFVKGTQHPVGSSLAYALTYMAVVPASFTTDYILTGWLALANGVVWLAIAFHRPVKDETSPEAENILLRKRLAEAQARLDAWERAVEEEARSTVPWNDGNSATASTDSQQVASKPS